ncbi:MAG: hypothetical protein ACJARD_001738 [Alphaproteobacteria bacterium]|jgi:hypothetical protein
MNEDYKIIGGTLVLDDRKFIPLIDIVCQGIDITKASLRSKCLIINVIL